MKVPFLAGRLRFSGAMFVECFPTQRQEAFLLGQRDAFEFWGGVPRMAVYDNLKPAVLQVLEGHSRREHDLFLHFQSVYRFEALFANVHAGWVHSTGRVRFQTNDYSAPIHYAYQRLTLKADPFRVRLYAGEELVADHPRCYEKRQVIEPREMQAREGEA